jgi:hypothetical protein
VGDQADDIALEHPSRRGYELLRADGASKPKAHRTLVRDGRERRKSIIATAWASRSIAEMDTAHRVAVVVDGDLAPELENLARTCPVWSVRSPETEAVARRLWDAALPKAPGAPDAGLTLFDPGRTHEESLLSILNTVELHHGEYGQNPPVNVIEVFGTNATVAIGDALATLGFAEVHSSARGFTAHRTIE